MILEKELVKRAVPPLPAIDPASWKSTRQKLIETMCEKVYGRPVPAPTNLSFEEGKVNLKFCAGMGLTYSVTVHATVCGRECSFPFTVSLPTTAEGPVPFFVLCNFHHGEPNMYLPIEEIIDRGFAVLQVNYKDVTSDDGDFSNGLAACVYLNGAEDRAPDSTGKIQMWAWANMRLMDYAMTCDKLDKSNAAVIGHSRLGKTALVTGMLDERFRYVISNDSGCSGAAITRRKEGERIKNITGAFPYWFCPTYATYADADSSRGSMDFDQHMLMATIAPRVLMVGSALADNWADPPSEQLGCVAASPAWEALGAKGYISEDRAPLTGDRFDEGNICYHMRHGIHFLSRLDWNIYMDVMEKKMK